MADGDDVFDPSDYAVGAAPQTGFESNLSPYIGDYVVDMLGRGRAAASQPYTAYLSLIHI